MLCFVENMFCWSNTTPRSIMELTANPWHRLPQELVDLVLDALTTSYMDDPTFQWLILRRISSHRMRKVEQLFLRYWLPKLTITLYSGSWFHIDYTLPNTMSTTCRNRVHFEADQDNIVDRSIEAGLYTLWYHYGFENRVAHLRLGEGVLNHGIREGHIVNDTDIVGLKVEREGLSISFDWKQTIHSLLREEMLMHKIQKQLVCASNLDKVDGGRPY